MLAHLSKTEEKQLAFALLHAIHDTLDQEAFFSVGHLAHSLENEPTYFSGKFEKHVGVTPTAYRLGSQPQKSPHP